MYRGPINWWVQGVIPVVFDSSLSYYEVLAKLTNYVTGIMNDVNEIENIIGTIEGIGDVTEFTKFLENIQKEIGNLSSLATTDKSDIVSALNEVAQKANLAYVKPPLGIPESDLTAEVRNKLNNGGGTANEYLINNRRLKPYPENNSPADLGLGTYTVPEGGIPEDTLSQEVRDKLNSGGGGGGGTTDYTALINKPQINGHTLKAGNNTLAELGIGTYNKPPLGIPEDDLSAEVREKLNTSGGIADDQTTFTADRDYAEGELLYINGVLYRTKHFIYAGTTLIPGNNIETTDISSELTKINTEIANLAAGMGLDSWELNAEVNVGPDETKRYFEYFDAIGGEDYLFIATPDANNQLITNACTIRVLLKDGTIVHNQYLSPTAQTRFTFTPEDTGEYYCDITNNVGNNYKYMLHLDFTQSQGITELWEKINDVSTIEPRVEALETLVGEQQIAIGDINLALTGLESDIDDLQEDVNNIKDTLNTGVETFFSGDVTGTRYTRIPVNIPAGTTLNISIANITSSDTDKTKSRIFFAAEDQPSTIGYVEFNRGEAVSATYTLDRDCVFIDFYASTNSSLSAGDTFEYSDVSISTPFIDKTLTLENKPADAKTVGDKFNEIERELETGGNRHDYGTPFDFSKMWYHFGMQAVSQLSVAEQQVIPPQSIYDIEMASRLGFKYIELNVQITSDGDFVCTHGISNRMLGHDFTDLLGNDAYGTVISDYTIAQLKSNFRTRSIYPKYRVPIASLEEALIACKKNNIAPLVRYRNQEELDLINHYMENNYILYQGNRSDFNGVIAWYDEITSASQAATICEEIGAPLILSISNPWDLSDNVVKDIIGTIHSYGCKVGGAYATIAQVNKYIAMGFDAFAITGNQVDIFDYGNLINLHGGVLYNGFTITGGSVTDGVIDLGDSGEVTVAAIDPVFLSKRMIRIQFTGEIKINDIVNSIVSDGTQVMIITASGYNQTNNLRIKALDTTIIHSLDYLVSEC